MQRESSKYIKLAVWVILLGKSVTLSAQWEKLFEFDTRFLGDIRIYEGLTRGILILNESGIQSAQVWDTRNGGSTWTQNPLILNSQYTSIAISNNSKVWIAPAYGDGDFIYRSLDGGDNWSSLSLSGIFGGLYYNNKSNLLFANDWGINSKTLVSNDNGDTWYTIATYGYPSFKTGFAFVSEDVGIEGGGRVATVGTIYNRTIDAGIMWNPTQLLEESFQPLAIRNTGNFYVASELTNNILRSTDFGLTWDTIYSFPQDYLLSGCIVGDLCHLYVQFNGNGTWESTDEGKSWHKIADHSGYRDTRFYFYNNALFIGATPQYNPVFVPGALWRYTLPPYKPQVVLPQINLQSFGCDGLDTSITYSALHFCDGDKVVLDSFSISGSPGFTILTNNENKEITSDTLFIHYEPSGISNIDSTHIFLRFWLKGNFFDTSFTIFGSGSSTRQMVDFSPGLSNSSAEVNSEFDYFITPNKAVSNLGLNEIGFTVEFYDDLLEVRGVSSDIPGATISTGTPIQNGRSKTLPIQITGTNLSLDPSQAIARVRFFTFLTDTTFTSILLDSIRLNGFDPDYERCTLSASSHDTTFTLALLCGDRTIVDFMRHGRSAIEITSIRPNPARDEVTVEIASELKEAVTVEIYDALGKLVQTSNGRARAIVLPVSGLSAGSYIVRLSCSGGTVSRNFVVER